MSKVSEVATLPPLCSRVRARKEGARLWKIAEPQRTSSSRRRSTRTRHRCVHIQAAGSKKLLALQQVQRAQALRAGYTPRGKQGIARTQQQRSEARRERVCRSRREAVKPAKQ